MRNTIYAGLLVAVTAALSQVILPLPISPVPISLGTLGMYLTGGLLSVTGATAAMTAYALLGAVGAPVFAGFAGGLGVIIGPTGGFIAGYIAGAAVIGALLKSRVPLWIAMIIGAVVMFALGIAWFAFIMKTGFLAAITMCVLPFLPGECLKIAIAYALTNRLLKIQSL